MVEKWFIDGGKRDLKNGYFPWVVEFHGETGEKGVDVYMQVHSESLGDNGTLRVRCPEIKAVQRLQTPFAALDEIGGIAPADLDYIKRRVRQSVLRLMRR